MDNERKAPEPCVIRTTDPDAEVQEVDVAKAWPLTWKDVKTLRGMNIDDEALAKGDPDLVEGFLGFVLKKANGGVHPGADFVDGMAFDDVGRALNFFFASSTEDDASTAEPPTPTS